MSVDKLAGNSRTTRMIETVATAESNRELADGYRLLTLNLNDNVRVGAGQFAMVRPHASIEPVLRRALAVYRVHGPRRVSFLYQVIGSGTSALAQLGEGDKVEALGPLGHRWTVDDQVCRVNVVAGCIGSE